MKDQIGISLFCGWLLLGVVGCDKTVVWRDPEPVFVPLAGGGDGSLSNPNNPLSQEVPKEIAQAATWNPAAGPEAPESVYLASGGSQSDVRTQTLFLTGPPGPPNAEELQALGEELIDALERGEEESLSEQIYADEAETLNAAPASGDSDQLISMAPEDGAMADEVDGGPYRLGPGDSIDVSIFDLPELSRNLIIRPDGYISFPLIDEIKAAGRRPAELEDTFEERLGEHIIDPDVSVVVTRVASKSYYIFGAVVSPGPYPYFRDTTLLQAIIRAGGPVSAPRFGGTGPFVDMSRVRVIRTHEEGREIITKNLKGLSEWQMMEEDIAIQPEDLIYIPNDENIVFVFGEIPAPGIVPIGPTSRVLEVILLSGGIPSTADDDQILLIRPGEHGPTYWCLDVEAMERGVFSHNLPVKRGDIIFVPQKPIAKLAEFVQLYVSALAPAMATYLTAWDAWFVHERFSSLRANNFGVRRTGDLQATGVNPDR